MDFADVSAVSAPCIAAIVSGVTATILRLVIMLAAGDRKVVGDLVPGRLLFCMGWLPAVAMPVAAIATLA